jgi:hypothetical protein
MNIPDISCDAIQQAMAIGEKLSDAQTSHVHTCNYCSALQSELAQLDQRMQQAMSTAVPPGFADRVMAQLPASSLPASETRWTEKLLGTFTASRLLQTAWLGVGIVIGVSHILRFVIGLFIAGMAAAM